MTPTALVVRIADEHDQDLLRGFTCSTGSVHETEVESFIQKGLLAWAAAPGAEVDDPRVLLLLNEANPDHLVAVAAHERLTELRLRGEPLAGTKIQVIAISLAERGGRIAGRRLGDIAFEALLRDIRSCNPQRGPAIAAVVSELNAPSLALCDRQGLTVSVARSPGYVWRIGRL